MKNSDTKNYIPSHKKPVIDYFNTQKEANDRYNELVPNGKNIVTGKQIGRAHV